jgi:predicted phage replisome organizer
MEGRFYWLKLKRDFFKRHDIRIIEAMPNGKDYILFYLKLLCESVDHEGRLRFNENIPYNSEMLATITNTNKDTVEAAVKMFTELGMMEMLDDGTLYMTECERMIGSAADNDTANRVRRFRERQKEVSVQALQNVTSAVTKCNESKSKSKRENNNYTAEFEEVWQAYPRKERKNDALKAYVAARKAGEDKDTILAGIARYKAKIAAEKTEAKYIAQGGTWFNQRRWQDEYEAQTFERAYDASVYEGVYE